MPEPAAVQAVIGGRKLGGLEALLRDFLASATSPYLVEPGEEPFAATDGRLALRAGGARGGLLVEVFDDRRVLARRAVAIRRQAPGRLELVTERLGGAAGTLLLYDAARLDNRMVGARSLRLATGSRFEQVLRKRFAGWRVECLETGPRHDWSLSGRFPRALVCRGREAFAALGCPRCCDAAEALTYGLLWFDHLRGRQKVAGLSLFVPEAAAGATRLRLAALDRTRARWRLFVWNEDSGASWEEDVEDCGNVAAAFRPPGSQASIPNLNLEALLEARVSHCLPTLDATLLPAPVYRQVGGESPGRASRLDLLALDRTGRLVVVELKASPSIHLPIQALDYAIAVDAARQNGSLARAGLFTGLTVAELPPRLLLAAPATAWHSANEIVLSYMGSRFAPERIGLASDSWLQAPRVLFRDRSRAAMVN